MVRDLFILALLITFFMARLISYAFHDRKNYGTPFDMSKTFTGILRRRTGFDLHHYHFGILIILLGSVLYYFFNGNFLLIFLAVGTSLFLDQADFLITLDREYFKTGYFRINSLVFSSFIHLILVLSIFFFV